MPTLVPGSGNWTAFNAVVSGLGQIGSGIYDTAKAIARWDVVQHRTIAAALVVAVYAVHAGLIDKVEFYLEGGTATTVSAMTLNPETGRWEYCATFDPASVSDGLREIRAIVYPVMGYCRVLSGAFDTGANARARGENSLFLNANHGATLPAAHVYCNENTGNNDTGDGSIGNPFASIHFALRKLVLDGTRDGGTIHCTAGAATWPNGAADSWSNNAQYCTLSLEGGAVLNAAETDHDNGLGCTFQRVTGGAMQGVTIGQASDTSGHLPPQLWIDNVTGDGLSENGAVGARAVDWTLGLVYTHCSIAHVQSAIALCTHVANCELSFISEDAMDNCQGFIADVYVHDQRQLPPHHSDVIQMNSGFDASSSVVENTLYVNIKTRRVGLPGEGVQGFFLRSNSNVGTHKDIALVNCDFAVAGNSQILHDVDHLVIWHCQFLKCEATDTGGSLLILDDANGGWPVTTITNISIRNCVFDNLTATWSGGTDPTTTAWADSNHFISSGNYGTNATTGGTYAALFTNPATEDYRPHVGSSLLAAAPRLSNALSDAVATARTNPTAIGAYAGATMTLVPNYAFPLIGGVKLRGANIVPRPADLGFWYNLWYDWCTEGGSGVTWTRWIKPQIDAVHALGGNAVRFICGAQVLIGDVSHHNGATWRGVVTQLQLETALGQLCDYLATLHDANGVGMFLYGCAGDSYEVNTANFAVADVKSFITIYVAKVSSYRNVIACDLVQEADSGGTSGTVSADNIAGWVTTAKAARVRSIPVTLSTTGADQATGPTGLDPATRPWFTTIAAAGIDFYGPNFYYKISVADLDPLLSNAAGLPLMITESGINFIGNYNPADGGSAQEVTHPYSSEQRADHYEALLGIGRRYNIQGLFVWATAPQASADGNNFGLYQITQNGSWVFTTPNLEESGPWGAIPTTIQARNAPDVLTLVRANRVGSNYNDLTAFAIGNRMVPLTSARVNLTSNAIELVGAVNAESLPTRDQYPVYQNRVLASKQQVLIFEIPPQTPTRWGTNYMIWAGFVRANATGGFYLIALQSDLSGAGDNAIGLLSCVGGVVVDLGVGHVYAPGNPLDLTHRNRVTVTVSNAVSPTALTATVRDVTAGIDMSPILSASDSTAGLQAAGSMGVIPYAGKGLIDVLSMQSFNEAGPTMAFAPTSGAQTATSVSLTFPAADGGTPTINYTIEYGIPDANGFVSAWTSGVSGTGTTLVQTGLVASTTYVFRVKAVDSAATPVTNYSRWLTQATPGGGGTAGPGGAISPGVENPGASLDPAYIDPLRGHRHGIAIVALSPGWAGG